jgi:GNAT superfamily N-acetyltransferase
VADSVPPARLAGAVDAPEVARLLHDFNTEFDSPSPGPEVLTTRLRRLLEDERTFAVLAGRPSLGVAIVTLRPNVWTDGPVALLDELYVVPARRGRGVGTVLLRCFLDQARRSGCELAEINVDEGDVDARRFYERNGFSAVEPDTGERALYYSQPLAP